MALLYEGVDTLGALVAEIEEKGATHLEVAGLAARLRGRVAAGVAGHRVAAARRAAPGPPVASAAPAMLRDGPAPVTPAMPVTPVAPVMPAMPGCP